MATSPQVAVAPPPARSSKLLIVLLIVVSLIAAAAVAYVVLVQNKVPAAATAEAPPPPPEKPIFVSLEPLTVNLQSEGRARFLHISMALKVRDEPAKGRVAELMPELRGRLLMLLSNRAADSFQTAEAKSKLAEEIRSELSRAPAEGQLPLAITSVSFNTFVVQ